jgi:hypothetical protein
MPLAVCVPLRVWLTCVFSMYVLTPQCRIPPLSSALLRYIFRVSVLIRSRTDTEFRGSLLRTCLPPSRSVVTPQYIHCFLRFNIDLTLPCPYRIPVRSVLNLALPSNRRSSTGASCSVSSSSRNIDTFKLDAVETKG